MSHHKHRNPYPTLATPFRIGTVEIKNRFCMAPMGGAQLFNPTGGFTHEAIEYYALRARGGFGLIFTGATTTDDQVDPFCALGPAILANPAAYIDTSAELNERCGAYGAKVFSMISMGLGRNYPLLPAPSPDPVWGTADQLSPELTVDQIKTKIDLMVKSAAVAKQAGYAGVEIHAMHWGYLLDQFGMAMTNTRGDEWGGPLENRLRCARLIVEGIKETCGAEWPVTMRLGIKSFVKDWNTATLTGEDEKGRTLEEGVEICKLLESYGYDGLSIDTGTYDSYYYACPPMYMPKGFFVELAAKATAAVSIPTMGAGRMDDAAIAEKAVAEGALTAVSLARQSLADPSYPNKVLSGHEEQVRPCIACNIGCIERLGAGVPCSCAVNPQAQREVRMAYKPVFRERDVLVVGGGVAGMEAARVAALRGHDVDLYEAADHLGGELVVAGSHSFKREIAELNEWYRHTLDHLDVDVHLGKRMDAEAILAKGADVVVLATGAEPTIPAVPGADDPKVIDSITALECPERVGESVIVVGGGSVGCECALGWAQEGKTVTVVEMLPQIMAAGAPAPVMNAQMMVDLLAYHDVRVMTGTKLVRIEEGAAYVEDGEVETKLEADTIVMAVGLKPRASMAAELQAAGQTTYVIGDERRVGTILTSVWDGFEVGNNI